MKRSDIKYNLDLNYKIIEQNSAIAQALSVLLRSKSDVPDYVIKDLYKATEIAVENVWRFLDES